MLSLQFLDEYPKGDKSPNVLAQPSDEYLRAVRQFIDLCEATPTPATKPNGNNPRLSDWPHPD